MKNLSTFIGMDVHMETIAVATAGTHGPCGYGVYRQITGMGHRYDVAAPSSIPKKAGRSSEDRSTRCSVSGAFASGR
jgi:hypothetical protein